MMTLHLPKAATRFPPKSSRTLCGKMIGETYGYLLLRSLLEPLRDIELGKVYGVYFTRKGYDKVTDRHPEARYDKTHGYWEGYLRGRDFKLCQHCYESEEFGLMALAEI